MGYDLYGKGGYFQCNIFYWRPLLDIALRYGWESQGTLMPVFDDEMMIVAERRGGGYCTNDHQRVTDEDANDLAAALKRALAEYQDTSSIIVVICSTDDESCISARESFVEFPLSIIEEFISFFEQGSFCIG